MSHMSLTIGPASAARRSVRIQVPQAQQGANQLWDLIMGLMSYRLRPANLWLTSRWSRASWSIPIASIRSRDQGG